MTGPSPVLSPTDAVAKVRGGSGRATAGLIEKAWCDRRKSAGRETVTSLLDRRRVVRLNGTCKHLNDVCAQEPPRIGTGLSGTARGGIGVRCCVLSRQTHQALPTRRNPRCPPDVGRR